MRSTTTRRPAASAAGRYRMLLCLSPLLLAACVLSRQVNRDGAGRMAMAGTLVVPAHGTVRMTPFSVNVMLEPSEPLPLGRRVPFTLVFRRSGTIEVTATVEPPGAEGR